jgi:hypothetical protein
MRTILSTVLYGSLVVGVGLSSVSCCSLCRTIFCSCSIDKGRVERCKGYLHTKYDADQSALESAQRSLSDRYADYQNGRMTCDKFQGFLSYLCPEAETVPVTGNAEK